jgi:putative ABC transport system ATP-binding protein
VAIARALTGNPRIVLADEPTGNLDSARSREIVALLHSLSRELQTGVLLVTHDTEAAAAADRRRMMRDGVLVGEPEPATGPSSEPPDAVDTQG